MKNAKFFVFAVIIAILGIHSAILSQPAQFSSRGPGGGGALFASSFNPTDPKEIYLCCDMSEIFHTTDLCASWSVLDFRQIESQKLAAVQFCNNNVRYAIDGANVNGSDLQRPSKSTDGGVTWKSLASDPTGSGAYTIFADANNNQHVILSDYATMYFSGDGGATFTQKYHTANNSAGLLLAGSFFDGNNIYIGTNEGVITSTDGGATFAKSNISGIPSTEFIVSFAGAKQGSTTRFFCVTLSQVYAGITGGDKNAYKNVYKSDVGSGAWQVAKTGIDATALPFFVAMATNNTSIAYVAGGSTNSNPTIYKTTDGGSTWTSVFKTGSNQNISTGWSGSGGDRAWSYGEYALGFSVAPSDPNYAIITDLGYAHYTSDGGTDWFAGYVQTADQNPKGSNTPTGKSYHSVGLENTTCWQINWLDNKNMFSSFSDIQGTRSTDGGATWGFNYTGHTDNSMYYVLKVGATTYGATSSVHDMYQSTTLTDARINGGKGKVLFSTNNGATWQLEHDFVHPVIWLASDPNDAKTLYASVINSTSGGIYVTHNADQGASSTWTKLTNPPRTEGHPLVIKVLKNGNLLSSFSGHRTSNFTASSGVFLSTDGGNTWQDRSDAGMKYWTWDVVVDPYDATESTWYAGVFSGWGGAANNLGGLYKTTNQGQSWTKIKASDGITSITFSPSDPNFIYFTGQTTGLWYSTNHRSPNPTFAQVASYPFRQPMRVFFNPNDTTEVWVSSFGHGMMMGSTATKSIAPDPTTLVSPANGSMNLPTTVTCIWHKSKNADGYRFQLASDPNFPSPFSDEIDYKDTQITVSGIAKGIKYYWRVQASNKNGNAVWSEVWNFQTIPNPPVGVALISPANDSDNCPLDQMLVWSNSAGAKTYELEVSLSKDFSSHLLDTSGLLQTSFTLHNLVKAAPYYWRVAASNDGGKGVSYETWKFTTLGAITVPNAIILISPENHSKPVQKVSELPPYQLTFTWNSLAEASHYDFKISQDSLFGSTILEDSSIVSNTYSFSAKKNTQYWWKVRGKNGAGWGAYSDAWTFSDLVYEGVKDASNSSELKLSSYPNPLSLSSTISFSLTEASVTSVKVFDLLGREMKSLSAGYQDAGNHSVVLDGSSLVNGAYILRLEANGKVASQIIHVVK